MSTAPALRWIALVAVLALATGQARAAEPVGEPAIWEMHGPDANVLLLGSVHVLRQSDYPLPVNVVAAMEQADCLILELDIDDIDPLLSQSLFQSVGRNPEGTSLEDVLGADTYADAAERSMELGVDLGVFGDFKPWFAALTIMNLQLMQIGFVPHLGLDQHLAATASASGKDIEGLETLEFQLQLFDSLPDAVQAQLLLQTLDEAEELAGHMDTLVSAWREGRVEVLANELGRTFSDYPELYRNLVTRRNADWTDKIIALGKQDRTCLVVVGALHLVGDDSLIDLLRDRGADVGRWSPGS